MQNSVVHVYLFIIILDTTTACRKNTLCGTLRIECHSYLGLKSRHHYCPQSNLHTVPNNTFMSENQYTPGNLRFLSAKSQKLFRLQNQIFLLEVQARKFKGTKSGIFVTVCNKSFACKLWSFFGRKGHKNNLNNTKTTSTVVYFNLGRRQKYIF